MTESLAAGAVLAAFVALVGLVHGAAISRATRSREGRLRHPRYWGR